MKFIYKAQVKSITKTIISAFVCFSGYAMLYAQQPEYHISTVFRQGEYGYHTFRIPAIVKANDGTLLAFAEGRKFSWADHEKNDIVLKRSFDNGETWNEMTLVQNEGDSAFIWIGNPAPVVDHNTGIVHLVFSRNNERLFHTFSKDNGATWTEREEILTGERDSLEWNWIGTGPGIGIQLERGKQAGRLIIPAHFRFRDNNINRKGNLVVFSDDGGKTWDNGLVAVQKQENLGMGENNCVELVKGSDKGNSTVYFLPRNNSADESPFRRLEAYSYDGGSTLYQPYRINKYIQTVTAQGALLRWSATDQGDLRNRILYSGDSRLVFKRLPKRDSRKHLAIWSSFDETQTWKKVPKRVWSGYSAYSSMVKTASGDLGVLFESGTDYKFFTEKDNRYSGISFARVNEAWLDMPLTGAWWDFTSLSEKEWRTRELADIFPGGNQRKLHAHGNVSRVELQNKLEGKTALHFDGRGKLVLPDSETWTQFDFSEYDSFTAEIVFRVNKGSDNSGSLISRIAPQGDPVPGWNINIDQKGYIIFLISDDDIKISMKSPLPLNDGEWHHLAAIRDSSIKIMGMYIDNRMVARVTDKTMGSLANRDKLVVGGSENLAQDNFIGDMVAVKISPAVLQPSQFMGFENHKKNR